MCALLAGIFNSRPPKPKYCFIWNVQTVIEFIRNEWGRNQELSDKFLSYKLTILLTLTSAFCVLGLQHLNIRLKVKTPIRFTFTFHKLHKALKKGKSPPSVAFHFFKEDNSLCVVEVSNEYLKRSEKWRTSEKCQFLLSFAQPHKPVVSSTISGWIKKLLTISGVDLGLFKGHSTHSASTSKATLSGLSVHDILERGCLSNSSLCQKFYNRQIELPSERFQKSVFN